MTDDIWTYQGDAEWSGLRIAGYRVEAVDGHIGKVDELSAEPGAQFIVVDTGPWIFGAKVLLPAGVITAVDPGNEIVFVSRTKQEIKNAPDFDIDTHQTPDYRDKLAGYYGYPRMP
jgi:hypothetical protein